MKKLLSIIAILLLAGCTLTEVKRKVTLEYSLIDPNNVIETEYMAFSHWEFIMKSDMQNAEVVLDGPYRHYAIERRKQIPDPETAHAIAEGVVDGAMKIGGVK